MINEKVLQRLFETFEEAIQESGNRCISITDRAEFLRKVYENELVYDGFVIVNSEKQKGVFYVDTVDLLGAQGMYRVSRPLKKSDFDIPANIPPLNTSVADAIDILPGK